jgi:hypothetical protein
MAEKIVVPSRSSPYWFPANIVALLHAGQSYTTMQIKQWTLEKQT